jgi:hypothetical protein
MCARRGDAHCAAGREVQRCELVELDIKRRVTLERPETSSVPSVALSMSSTGSTTLSLPARQRPNPLTCQQGPRGPTSTQSLPLNDMNGDWRCFCRVASGPALGSKVQCHAHDRERAERLCSKLDLNVTLSVLNTQRLPFRRPPLRSSSRSILIFLFHLCACPRFIACSPIMDYIESRFNLHVGGHRQ